MKEKWIRCLKVEPGKILEECTLENSLSALQEAVGGLVELLDMEDLGNGVYVTMLCNEKGKINGIEDYLHLSAFCRQDDDGEISYGWQKPPVSRRLCIWACDNLDRSAIYD